MIINLKVTGRRLELVSRTENEIEETQLRFLFSDSWNGLCKMVILTSAVSGTEQAVCTDSEDSCFIPPVSDGEYEIYVCGALPAEAAIVTNSIKADLCGGGAAIAPNPMIMSIADEMRDTAEMLHKDVLSAAEAAETLVNAAENYEAFKGKIEADIDTLEDKHDSELQALSAELADNTAALEDVQGTLKNKVDKISGKVLSSYDFNYTYKSKLDGIDKGAQKNTVTSVAGKTGAVTLEKADVGLDNVDNTSDMDKPVSTATQQAIENVQVTLNFLRSETARKFTEVFYIVERGDDTLPLSDHTDIRINVALTTLTLTMPSNYSDFTDYECYLTFITGDTPTVLTYPDTAIKWVGVDCNSDGGFIPTANKTYEIGIKNIGVPGEPIIIARVGVC